MARTGMRPLFRLTKKLRLEAYEYGYALTTKKKIKGGKHAGEVTWIPIGWYGKLIRSPLRAALLHQLLHDDTIQSIHDVIDRIDYWGERFERIAREHLGLSEAPPVKPLSASRKPSGTKTRVNPAQVAESAQRASQGLPKRSRAPVPLSPSDKRDVRKKKRTPKKLI